MQSEFNKSYLQNDSKLNFKVSQPVKSGVNFVLLSVLMASLGLAINYKFGKVMEDHKEKGAMNGFVIR